MPKSGPTTKSPFSKVTLTQKSTTSIVTKFNDRFYSERNERANAKIPFRYANEDEINSLIKREQAPLVFTYGNAFVLLLDYEVDGSFVAHPYYANGSQHTLKRGTIIIYAGQRRIDEMYKGKIVSVPKHEFATEIGLVVLKTVEHIVPIESITQEDFNNT